MGREQYLGRCEHCSKTFNYYLVHNGFNDSAYGYCDQCSYTVILSGWTKAPHGVKLKIQGPLTEDIPPFLKPCPCGGVFRAPGAPRCPHCCEELSAILAAAYIEANAAGTKKGWRWERRWDGIYGIVLENRLVEDWWR